MSVMFLETEDDEPARARHAHFRRMVFLEINALEMNFINRFNNCTSGGEASHNTGSRLQCERFEIFKIRLTHFLQAIQ